MQPKTSTPFDRKTFDRLKRTIKGISEADRKTKVNPTYARKIPLDIGIELTNRCNLRCKHCFLWNNNGLYNKSDGFEFHDLEIEILDKILKDTIDEKSRLYFWGTEPLTYKYWDELCSLLESDKRWTVVCTNGTLIDDKIDSILKISENTALVVSMDGLEKEHDNIRGKGNFSKLIKNINLIIELQKKKIYKGKLTVHCVLNDNIINYLFEFCEFIESLGVDSLYLGFPWFINQQSSKRMDDYYNSKLSFISSEIDDVQFITGQKDLKSWHTYNFHLNPTKTKELIKEMEKIINKVWKIRFRFQPAVEFNEVYQYVLGSEKPIQNKTKCLALSTRIDIRCNGQVTSCQPFPELIMGDLHSESLFDIWHGDKFNKMRNVISEGLTPVCSRCILLYLNGK